MEPNIPWILDNTIYDEEQAERLGRIRKMAAEETFRASTSHVQSKFTDIAVIDEIYYLLDGIHQIFKSHNIKYWASFGTLLGSHRHSGVIPWDDDADICVLVEFRPKIQELSDVFKANGIEMVPRCSPGTQTYTDKYYYFVLFDKDNQRKTPYPMVDMFFCETTENGSVTPIANWGTQAHLFLNEIEPIHETKFGNIELNIPHSANSILEREYGTDYMEKGEMAYCDHEKDDIVTTRPVIFDMKPFIGVPALSNYITREFVVKI